MTTVSKLSLALILSALLLVAGCIGGGTSGPQPCQPGTTNVCYCSGGGQGTAVCQQNGYLGQCTGCTGGSGGDAGGQQGLDASGDGGQSSDGGTQTDTSGGGSDGSQNCAIVPVCLSGNVYERNSCTDQVSEVPVQTCESGCTDGICDDSTCTPSCNGAQCGPDGCGGTCGDCAGTETCTDGVCVSGGGGSGSCTDPADPDQCMEGTDDIASQLPEICGAGYSTSPCPTTNLVGLCDVELSGSAGSGVLILYYYSPGYTNTTAQSDCVTSWEGTYTSM